LVIVVAIQRFYVDPSFSHAATNLTQLTRFCLVQSLDQHFTFFDHPDACLFKRPSSSCAIFEKEVGYTLPVDDEGPSTLDAYSGASQHVAHLGKRAWFVFKLDS
jgi:hypothetical protein